MVFLEKLRSNSSRVLIMNKIDISYASKSEHNFAQRLLIKTIEQLTGKRKLQKIYSEFSKEKIEPRFFWTGILKSMKIEVINRSKVNTNIPKKGKLLMIANHPFGIIDGIIMCSIASKIRSDFKILTHETLGFAPELNDYILPIDFKENSKITVKNNIETSKNAKKHLLSGGLLIIFPSGSVSVAKNLKSAAKDDEWKQFTAKIIKQTKADVLPVYFDGKNGLLYHLFASKLKNQTLKYSSYIHETKKMIGKEVYINIGKVIKYSELEGMNDRSDMTEYLKYKTYNLGNEK